MSERLLAPFCKHCRKTKTGDKTKDQRLVTRENTEDKRLSGANENYTVGDSSDDNNNLLCGQRSLILAPTPPPKAWRFVVDELS